MLWWIRVNIRGKISQDSGGDVVCWHRGIGCRMGSCGDVVFGDTPWLGRHPGEEED